jgi:hypothetical protein
MVEGLVDLTASAVQVERIGLSDNDRSRAALAALFRAASSWPPHEHDLVADVARWVRSVS